MALRKEKLHEHVHCVGNFLFLIPSCVYGGNIPHGCQITVEPYLVCDFFLPLRASKDKARAPIKTE